jgi:hypothetical protein
LGGDNSCATPVDAVSPSSRLVTTETVTSLNRPYEFDRTRARRIPTSDVLSRQQAPAAGQSGDQRSVRVITMRLLSSLNHHKYLGVKDQKRPGSTALNCCDPQRRPAKGPCGALQRASAPDRPILTYRKELV